MSLIQIKNLSFRYDNGIENIFDDVSVNLDTNWRLGLIGRNGKGKTTLLQILSGKLKYDGIITKNVDIDYFPFKVDENKLTMEVIQDFCMAEDWEIIKELNILNFNIEALYRTFQTLSGGEKVKAMLVALFLKDNNFLLIVTLEAVELYSSKKSFEDKICSVSMLISKNSFAIKGYFSLNKLAIISILYISNIISSFLHISFKALKFFIFRFEDV